MTAEPAAAGRSDRSQDLYEELRRHAVTGSAGGGRHGLVVLVREGLAAWLARRSSCADVIEPGSPPHRPVGAALGTDATQADLVRVLASLALGGHDQGHHPEVNA